MKAIGENTSTSKTLAVCFSLVHCSCLLKSLQSVAVTRDDVGRCFVGSTPGKQPLQTGFHSQILRDCADLLAEIFCHVFNLALTNCTVLKCLQSPTLPVAKQQQAAA